MPSWRVEGMARGPRETHGARCLPEVMAGPAEPSGTPPGRQRGRSGLVGLRRLIRRRQEAFHLYTGKRTDILADNFPLRRINIVGGRTDEPSGTEARHDVLPGFGDKIQKRQLLFRDKFARQLDLADAIDAYPQHPGISALVGTMKLGHLVDLLGADAAIVRPDNHHHPAAAADDLIDIARLAIEVMQNDIGRRGKTQRGKHTDPEPPQPPHFHTGPSGMRITLFPPPPRIDCFMSGTV